jgi:hypothetical protein
VPRGRRGGSLRSCTRFSGPDPLVFLPGGSSVVLAGLGGLRSGPTGGAGNRTRTSGSAGRRSDRRTAGAVCFLLHGMCGFGSCFTGGAVLLRFVAAGSGRWTTEADLYYTQVLKLNL